jgi:hypothetical protein
LADFGVNTGSTNSKATILLAMVANSFRNQIDRTRDRQIKFTTLVVMTVTLAASVPATLATTGVTEIVTPDLQPEGELGLSFQVQSKKIGNPYQLQAEMGLTKWSEVAVSRGFDPDEWIFGTEIGLLTEKPWLLSIGFLNWSPHLDLDPEPFVVAGYYGQHHKVIGGAADLGHRHEAILGYTYVLNEDWEMHIQWQSGSGNSVAFGFAWNITQNLQVNPAIYVTNDSPHEVLGLMVFTYTLRLWGGEKESSAISTK